MNKMKKWNVLVDENGNVNAITTRNALRQYERQLKQRARQEAESLKHLLHFDLVSDLENVDLGEYLENYKPIHKNEVNGIDDLIAFAGKIAKERGIVAPCLCWIELGGEKFNLVGMYDDFVVLNSLKVVVEEDYERQGYSDKGSTPYGWAHPSITEFYEKEVNEPDDYDYCLKSTRQLRNYVYCGIDYEDCCSGRSGSYDGDVEFDVQGCKGCEFYHICKEEPIVGATYYYIKAKAIR